MLSFMERSQALELMDTEKISFQSMQSTLRFLSLTNDYFGGKSIILRHFKKWSQSWPKGAVISVLDVGCGGGDLCLAVGKWAKTNGFQLSVTGIDIVPDIVAIAKEKTLGLPNIKIELKNFFKIDHYQEQYDYVISSLFLHHTIGEESLRIIHKMSQVAQRGVLISDLERSLMGYFAVSACSLLLGNKIVRHDGPLSVRRSFTLNEIKEVLQANRVPDYLSVRREPWFRLSISGEKPR